MAASPAFEELPRGFSKEAFGYLFESQVIHDLRVYAQAMGGRILHYRTKDGTAEIDAIIELKDGRWAGGEVKLNAESVTSAASRLVKIAQTIGSAPIFLALVVPGGVFWRLENGVWPLPLALLGS